MFLLAKEFLLPHSLEQIHARYGDEGFTNNPGLEPETHTQHGAGVTLLSTHFSSSVNVVTSLISIHFCSLLLLKKLLTIYRVCTDSEIFYIIIKEGM